MARILIIGHEAGRTGAPIVLLHLLKWLRKHQPDLKMDILLLRGGELVSEFRELGEVFVLDPESSINLARRGLKKLRGKPHEWFVPLSFNRRPFNRKYDLVFGNTITTLYCLKHFKRRGSRTICWMHEMRYVATSFFSPQKLAELSKSVDKFIVPSKAVERTLIDLGVTVPVEQTHEITPPLELPNADLQSVRESLGIPSDAFVVGGGGTVEWRKGTDLFLQIAAKVCKQEANIYFVWIGGRTSRSELDFDRIVHDLELIGLDNRIRFTGITDEPANYMAVCDVFALTSREDPFPLMCLEAASLGKPLICFDKAGGMVEFVENDAGSIVPYMDTDAFADEIMKFYGDRQVLRDAGIAAQEKLTNRFSADDACRRIDAVINSVLASDS
jgi:glycosyltransferase involved in cell wall biosynthesis